jgi:hypothetical protein
VGWREAGKGMRRIKGWDEGNAGKSRRIKGVGWEK